MADPNIDPYQVGKQFTYYPRWTGDHFAFFRTIVRAMCMDAGDELKGAWKRANASPASAAAWTFKFPTLHLTTKDGKLVDFTVSWRNAPDLKNFESIEVSRALMLAYRDQYANVK